MNGNTRPARTSVVLAGAVGFLAIAALFREISGFYTPGALGVVGVLCLTIGFYLAVDGTGPAEGFLLSLLTVPVGIGFVGALLWATVLLIGEQFPVPVEPEVSLALLAILGGLAIITGCLLAVFGLTLGARNVLTEQSTTHYMKTAFVTASIPLTAAMLFFISVPVGGTRTGSSESVFGVLVSRALSSILSPDSSGLHLASFLFVVTITGISVVLFLRRVPVAEILTSRGNLSGRRLETELEEAVHWTVTVTAVLFLFALLFELVLSSREIERVLGTGIYELMQVFTTAGWLRTLLLVVTVLTLGWLAVDFLLQQWVNWSDPEKTQWVGPLVAGGIVTLVAWGSADTLFDRLLDETTSRLPPSIAAELQDAVLPVVSVYGEAALVVFAVGLLVGLTGILGFTCWTAVYYGYLTGSGGGFSIASAGLVFATVGVVIREPSVWLVFGGVVASLVVWDLGRFGTELGREVGESTTRSVEIVHASGTLGVGLVGVLIAWVLESRAGTAFDPSPESTLALLCLVVGLVAFSVALRDSY